MRPTQACSLALVASTMFPWVSYANPPQVDFIQVKEVKEAYQVSVPVSQLIMNIPKAGSLKEVREMTRAHGPRYFHFQDDKQHLIISGWFESAQRYPGMEKFWKGEEEGL